jgi:hypothetical protein
MKIENETITLTREELHGMMERAARYALVHAIGHVTDLWTVDEVPKQAASLVQQAVEFNARVKK